jgi:hypothetical protein
MVFPPSVFCQLVLIDAIVEIKLIQAGSDIPRLSKTLREYRERRCTFCFPRPPMIIYIESANSFATAAQVFRCSITLEHGDLLAPSMS